MLWYIIVHSYIVVYLVYYSRAQKLHSHEQAPAQASQTPQEEASAAMRDRSPRADSAQQADPSNSPKEHGENSREKLAELERADPSDPQRLDVCDGLVGEAASETRSEHPASTLQEPVDAPLNLHAK